MLDMKKILNENVVILPSGVVTICEGIEINHKKVYKHFFFFFFARHAQIASCIRKRVTHLGCALKAIFIEFIHLIRV